MTDITPTEFLAMKLWGWELSADQPDKLYREYRRDYRSISLPFIAYARFRYGSELELRSSNYWPNFNPTSRECWYWIRQMEEKLAERGLMLDYVQAIHMAIPADERGDNRIDPMLATPAQRIAAAVRVLGGGE